MSCMHSGMRPVMSKAQVNRLVRLIKDGDVSGADELYHLLERLIPDLNSSLKKSTAVLNSQEDPHPRRVSVFLQERTKSLHQLLRFFLAGSTNVPSVERRAYFISHLDFWENQVNELIRDFGSFGERSTVWKSWDTLDSKIKASGHTLRRKVKEDLKWAIRWRRRYQEDDMDNPTKELNSLISDWNQILRSASKILQRDEREDFISIYKKSSV